MNNRLYKIVLASAMSFVLCVNMTFACSWAAFTNGKASIVARTVDWYFSDNGVVKGYGRNVRMKAADTQNALEYTTKYANMQIHCFESALPADAMNEKGLQGSILFLDGSRLPAAQPGRKDMDPNNFIAYAVSSFATVQEVVNSLAALNFVPAPLALQGDDGKALNYESDMWPCHYAFADATGDRAIIEFINGEVVVYHGKQYDAMTNEPRYEIQLEFENLGYVPNGSISTVDRRMRAKHYLRDMHERGVKTTSRALLAMRGLIATMFAGAEEIDRTANEVYPTIWGALADQNNKRYYLSRVYSWCSEIYDFSMFDPSKPEVTILKKPDCPYEELDITGVL